MGSLRLAPTLGVFAAGTRQLAFESSQNLFRAADAQLAAGLQIETPLSFRLFGQTATVAPSLRYSLVDSPSNLHRLTGSTVFRLDF